MKKTIGFWRAWGLVVGITIGNGIFMLPAYLAPYGELSIVGWIFAGGGTLFIAILLGKLAKKLPMLGGPYVYTREAFGDLPGFLVAWGYWISLWTAVGAGGVAFSGYLMSIFPTWNEIPYLSPLIAIVSIWIVTGINLSGAKSSGTFQLITTLMKIAPLFLVAIAGLFMGDFAMIRSESIVVGSERGGFSTMILVIMWAFVGIEGVTVPANSVKNPGKTIPRALLIGTSTVALIYLVVTLGVMSIIPNEELAQSTSPIADAARFIFGKWGGILVAVGALISIIGSQNGNVWVSGSTPQAVAGDGLFPAIFGRTNKAEAPDFALLISSFLASLMIVMNYSGGMLKVYLLLITLSTLGTLLPYLMSALAEMYFIKIKEKDVKWKHWIVPIGALGFVIFALMGTSLEEFIWGGVMLSVGLVIYLYRKNK